MTERSTRVRVRVVDADCVQWLDGEYLRAEQRRFFGELPMDAGDLLGNGNDDHAGMDSLAAIEQFAYG